MLFLLCCWGELAEQPFRFDSGLAGFRRILAIRILAEMSSEFKPIWTEPDG